MGPDSPPDPEKLPVDTDTDDDSPPKRMTSPVPEPNTIA